MARSAEPPLIEALGERSLLLRFGNAIEPALNARVHLAAQALRTAALAGVDDIVPSYAALAVNYEPGAWNDDASNTPPWQRLADAVLDVIARDATGLVDVARRCIDIPVRYGGTDGPDLAAVAEHSGLDVDAVVARHLAGDYQVAMLGFAPGFAYLTGLDPLLHTPRRQTPRLRVPAGSVAIGGAQTGIYPGMLPGGWQIIGCTARVLFDAQRDPPSLLEAGDRVRFVAIGQAVGA
ncbi:MAG: 5-oxoprolinase subunit PxpB [Rhodanobacteraceae bacterium]